MAISRIKNWIAEILEPTDLNAEFNNIINNALSLISPLTGNLAAGNNKITGLAAGTTTGDSLRYEQVFPTFNTIHGADIASAGTVNLETATGNVVDITGTTTITAITLSEGHERTTRFTGALTLTNGASLVLLGGTNITTVAGDYAIWIGYAAGVVRMVHFGRGTGEALHLIRSQTASTSASIDFTSGLTSSYDQYLLLITDLVPATNATDLYLRVSQSAAFLSGATDYRYTFWAFSSSPATANNSNGGNPQILIANLLTNATSDVSFSCAIRFYSPAVAALRKHFMWQSSYDSSSGFETGNVGSGSLILNGDAIDGIRFLMSSGNILTGTFALYGVRKT